MKKFKSAIAVILAMLMAFTFVFTAAAEDEKSYKITNPYASIDWDTIGTYKTALHTHTNASDGDPTLKESIERHVETGFDIVATTDHGTTNYSWAETCPNNFIHGVLSLVGKSEGELVYLGTDGTFENGMSYTLETRENGDDYLSVNGKEVLRVPYGIENNAVSVNAHVNSWFVDYSDNTITDYVDAIKSVDALDGVSVINHPGEYSKARYELYDDDAYNINEPAYRYLLNKWANLLDKYDTCIGVDMNSKGDKRTRFDRILWDELLTRFSAKGENVYGMCSSDAHSLSVIDTGFVLALMPTLDSASLKTSLLNGEFFGASHCIGSPEELREIADALKELYGETELYKAVNDMAVALVEKAAQIDNGELDADESLGLAYTVLDDDGYTTCDTFPAVTSIETNDEAGTITINTTDALIVRWISNGELITTTTADEATFTLSDYAEELGDYVRAEIFGDGGIIYTQAFLLNADSKDENTKVVDDGFIDFGAIDFLVGTIANWMDILGRFFKNLF